MKYPDARLLVFSKAPVAGQVKTRLIPLLGAEAAARLYAGLLDDTLRKAVEGKLCPVELWCTPSVQHADFLRCRACYPLTLRQQGTGDLGMRMSQALEETLLDSRYAVLTGADCPALEAADIDAALAHLAAGTDVVLGPAMDGGYYLIGMARPHRQLFDAIPWGTARVLAATLAHCRAHGLRWSCLARRFDLDTPEDYRAYYGDRPAGLSSG